MNKQVIVWRNDLKVRKGKFATQIAHASEKVFFDRMKPFGYEPSDYPQPRGIECHFTNEMIEWAFNKKFTKIVARCHNLEELLDLERQAKEAKIPCALIEDSGATEFKETCQFCNGTGEGYGGTHSWTCSNCNGTGKVNVPTITCLAIGPDDEKKIDKITGHLELM